MMKIHPYLPVAILATLAFFGTLQAQQISYQVAFPEPHTHFAEVQMELDQLKKAKYIDVSLPTWAPGSYLIREFSKSLENIKAQTGAKTLQIEKLDKNTWRIHTDQANSLTISYRIHAFEHTVRTSIVDIDHAYLNGTSIFLYVKGMKDQPVTVEFKPYQDWKVISTTLGKVAGNDWKRSAKNYDQLVDCPVEIGNHTIQSFEAAGIKHDVALVGRSNVDPDKLIEGIRKIVEATTSIFGTNPCKEYLFIIHFTDGKGGGLEHTNSTTCFADRHQFSSQSGYERFWGLAAHEYFHLWNIKRLRPEALGPFDYESENYTSMLWVVEGFTSYFDEKILRMANIYSPERYLGNIAANIDRAENNPGKEVQPVGESSFDAWIKYYRQSDISPNSFVSYYTRGAALAALLDLMIIQNSNGDQDLGDFMKTAYQKFYEANPDKGYTDQAFKAALEKFTGTSLDDFYTGYVHGTKQIDYNAFLQYAGLQIKVLPDPTPSLGIKTKTEEGKMIITKVRKGSAAWDGGLNLHDEILGIDQWRIDNLNSLSNYLRGKKEGEKITIHLSRNGIIREIQLSLAPDGSAEYQISQIENPTEQQLKVLNKWLVIE